ncbi:hypothetical protein [Parenemella sanctibonifatiensis]|uniref:Uncharacterized protein n=1 Tax=Parenemella sanctibonifatiensis TaxID=2016505 RepID=A0A255E8V0_9ACTN|nr:hypothetical protein [Parenemella sanctibonifatiensis]OYN87936.1 hypothetical protein CGZ92_06670 [Parenemella sanctibonifatiensis]
MITLLKHEFLRTRSLLGLLFGAALAVVAVAVVFVMTDLPLFSSLGAQLILIAPTVLVGALPLVLGIDYWRSSHGRTGYFTQTLPIPGPRIFAAKLVWSFTVILAALVWALALVLIGSALTVPNFGATLQELWTSTTALLPLPILVVGVLVMVWMLVSAPVQYFFAASVGSEARFGRLGAAAGPIIVFTVLYFVYQVLVLAAMFLLPLAIGPSGGGIGLIIINLTELASSNDIVPLGFVPVMVLVPVVLIWRTAVSWKSKISLA